MPYELQDVVAKLNSIIELLSERGNRAGNIVGGAVIDIIRGYKPRDFDVVIYNVDHLQKKWLIYLKDLELIQMYSLATIIPI